MAEQLEFYFPKTKSKHMAYAKMGKQYPSKGGTVRYGVQAIRDGGKSLPKYITEEDFNKYGFEYTRLDVHNNCSDLECLANRQDYLPCVEVQNGVIRKYRENPSNIKYPKEFLDAFYDFDSNPTADTQDDETVELAYQVWYQKQAENEVLNAEVSVGEKQVKSRKDYDIDNELSGFSNMEVGDIDLEDYEDEITESVEDEVIEAIRESVDENMPISDGDSVASHVNVDTELEITVPISGDIEYDWTANETHEEEVDEDEWNAESLDFHGENYQNHLKVIKKAPYGGIGSLFGIGGDTELGGFSTGELTGSSAIHGDFDSASLNYSGHQNLQVRAESDKLHGWATTMLRDVKDLIEDLENGAVYDLDDCRERLEKIRDDTSHLNAETFEADDWVKSTASERISGYPSFLRKKLFHFEKQFTMPPYPNTLKIDVDGYFTGISYEDEDESYFNTPEFIEERKEFVENYTDERLHKILEDYTMSKVKNYYEEIAWAEDDEDISYCDDYFKRQMNDYMSDWSYSWMGEQTNGEGHFMGHIYPTFLPTHIKFVDETRGITLYEYNNKGKSIESYDAETFGAFSIDEDDEGKIHIENKCDGCGKEFLFTQNSNIVGGNRAGAIVYENLDWKDEYGETGHDYPEYSPYGDLLCKSCWKINREEDENADSRGQGQYGAEMEECIACGNETFDGNKEVCIDCGSGMNLWSSEDSPSPSSPLEEVPATVPSPAEPTNESFSAEKMGWDIKEYGNKEKYASKDGVEVIIAPISKSSYQYHPRDAKWKLTYGRETPHGVVPLAKLFGTYGEVFRWLNDAPFEVKSFGAEMDELSEDTSIIRNQVGDMVGMVELDENDEDIEKVDIDIIDDDGEMAYEGTLGAETFEEYECSWCGKDIKEGGKFYFVDGAWQTDALCVSCKEEGDDEDADWGKLNIRDGTWDAETFESQGTNTKMILGITALAVGLGLWKGKEIMSISEKISQSIKNMKK